MKKLRVVFIILALSLVALTFTVDASSLNTISATQPWKPQLFDADEPNVKNLSTIFVGNQQVPFMIYNSIGYDDSYWITIAHGGAENNYHNCGPGNTWSCTQIQPYGHKISPGIVSNVSVYQIIDTFKVGWAYKSDTGYIYVYWREYNNNMALVGSGYTQLIDLSLFAGSGYELTGPPSLIVDGFYYKIAFIIRDMDTNISRLVYAYRNPGNSSPCLAGSDYQCDVIDIFYGVSGSPSLAKIGETVGIAYYHPVNDAVMYAYPYTGSIIGLANCGPEPYAYRCISIYNTGEIGSNVELAFGQTSSDRGIVFTRDDTMIENTLYVADYVGSNGNCGVDTTFTGSDERWQCDEVVELTGNLYPSYSIQMDPEGYPVVAYDNPACSICYKNLFLSYPSEHIGLTGEEWITQRIDGELDSQADFGGQVDLALDQSGRGFLAYIMQEDYVNPAIKIALQWYTTYMPAIVK